MLSQVFTKGKLYLSSELRHFLPHLKNVIMLKLTISESQSESHLTHPHEDLLPEQVAVHADHSQSNWNIQISSHIVSW